MPQFEVFRLNGGQQLVLDVQADRIGGLDGRVVVPLRHSSEAVAITWLNPVLEFKGKPHIVQTQALAAVPRRMLGRPVGQLSEARDAITYALDMLFTGF